MVTVKSLAKEVVNEDVSAPTCKATGAPAATVACITEAVDPHTHTHTHTLRCVVCMGTQCEPTQDPGVSSTDACRHFYHPLPQEWREIVPGVSRGKHGLAAQERENEIVVGLDQ